MIDPFSLLFRFGDGNSPGRRYLFYRCPRAHSASNEQASRNQSSATDSLPTMDEYILTGGKSAVQFIENFSELGFGVRNLKIRNWKRGKLQPVCFSFACLSAEIHLPFLVGGEQGKHGVYFLSLPTGHLLAQPVPTPGAGCQSYFPAPRPIDPIQSRCHRYSCSFTTTSRGKTSTSTPRLRRI